MPTLKEAYIAKDILQLNNRVEVIVLGGNSFLVKDSRITGEKEATVEGWKPYTYAQADSTFGTLPTPA